MMEPETMMRSASASPFEPVIPIRAHEYVAEQIRRHVKLRLVAPGKPLPSERSLAAQFEVGRPTIQMALRLLEAERLVEVRRGRTGGTFVLDIGKNEDARFEQTARILGRRDEIEQLLVFRDAIEPEIVAVTCATRDADDLEHMRAVVAALDAASGEVEYMRLDTELHLAFAAATRNRFLTQAGEQVRSGLNDVIAMLPESDIWHTRIRQEHHALLKAIEERDQETARIVMRAHTEHTRTGVHAVMTAIGRLALSGS